jgi:hypothetical protein
MKKLSLFVVFIVILFIGSNSATSNIIDSINSYTNNESELLFFDNGDDLLDQSQEEYNSNKHIYGNFSQAQSFTPSLTTLTRVELLMCQRRNPTEVLHFYILGEFDGTTYVHITKSVDEFPEDYENIDWVEFDFPDVNVIPGEKYYIVLLSSTPSGGFWPPQYSWGESTENLYPNGESYFWDVNEEVWVIDESYDFCFRTYGFNLYNSMIFGKIYDLNAEGDYVKCNTLKVRCIIFSPFSFNTYQSDERIIIEKPYKGIIAPGIIFMRGQAAIF